VVKREGRNLSPAYLGRLPWGQLTPGNAFAKPALCARKRQVEGFRSARSVSGAA
jgi:hypothetical protein